MMHGQKNIKIQSIYLEGHYNKDVLHS